MNTVLLFAPEAYWKLPESERKGKCGPGKGVLEKLVPDIMYGLKVTPACSIHDWMYLVGEDIEDKKEADRVFLNNLIRIIEAKDGIQFIVKLRLRRAKMYYQAVNDFGGPAFWANKNKPSEVRTVKN